MRGSYFLFALQWAVLSRMHLGMPRCQLQLCVLRQLRQEQKTQVSQEMKTKPNMKGFDVEMVDILGHGAQRVDELKARLASGLDPNYRLTRDGKTAETLLEASLWYSDATCVQALLDAKANVNVPCLHRESRHKLSLLNCCRNTNTKAKANLLIRHGLKLTRVEEKIRPSDPWPRLNQGFFENREAYLLLQKRKARCRQVCMILLHRRNLRHMPLDLRRDWIKRMVWPTRFDSEWAMPGEFVDPHFDVDASAPILQLSPTVFQLFGWM